MKKAVHFILTALFILFSKNVPYAASEWRTPTPDDLGRNFIWRDEDPDRYLLVKADLDGDKKEDIAHLLINDIDDTIGLFVTLTSSKQKTPLLLETIKDKRMIEVFGIDSVKPGKYQTACGKRYWQCEKGEPKQVHLKNPGIDFFKYESANSFFIWNQTNKRFDRIWISD